MTGKEVIRRVLEFNDPPGIGFNFNPPHLSDMAITYSMFSSRSESKYNNWGFYPELLEKVPGFTGEVRMDDGSIYGRYNNKTHGECIYGALQDGWENYDEFSETILSRYRDENNYSTKELNDWVSDNKDRFTAAAVMSLQSLIRDSRKIDNMLTDTICDTDNLKKMVNDCADIALFQVDILHKAGVDSAKMLDDWGLQHTLYISPKSWREIWKEPYSKVIQRLHEYGMKFLLHSCGYIREIIDDLCEIGVDGLQLDQPSVYDFDDLSQVMRGRTTLWSPVDIQKILPTGNKSLIQNEAGRMIKMFHNNGGFIAKDYPGLDDIGVPDEYAGWAREVFYSEGGRREFI